MVRIKSIAAGLVALVIVLGSTYETMGQKRSRSSDRGRSASRKDRSASRSSRSSRRASRRRDRSSSRSSRASRSSSRKDRSASRGSSASRSSSRKDRSSSRSSSARSDRSKSSSKGKASGITGKSLINREPAKRESRSSRSKSRGRDKSRDRDEKKRASRRSRETERLLGKRDEKKESRDRRSSRERDKKRDRDERKRARDEKKQDSERVKESGKSEVTTGSESIERRDRKRRSESLQGNKDEKRDSRVGRRSSRERDEKRRDRKEKRRGSERINESDKTELAGNADRRGRRDRKRRSGRSIRRGRNVTISHVRRAPFRRHRRARHHRSWRRQSRFWLSFGFGGGSRFLSLGYGPAWGYSPFWYHRPYPGYWGPWAYPGYWNYPIWYHHPGWYGYDYHHWHYQGSVGINIARAPVTVYGEWTDSSGEVHTEDRPKAEPESESAPPAPDIAVGERYLEDAIDAFRDRNYDEALKLAQQSSLKLEDQGPVFLLLGQAQFAAGKYMESAETLHRALGMMEEEDWGIFVENYRDYYGKIGDYTRQLRALESYMKQELTAPFGSFLLGYHYGFLGYPDHATNHLEEAVELAQADDVAKRLLEIFQGQSTTTPTTGPAD